LSFSGYAEKTRLAGAVMLRKCQATHRVLNPTADGGWSGRLGSSCVPAHFPFNVLAGAGLVRTKFDSPLLTYTSYTKRIRRPFACPSKEAICMADTSSVAAVSTREDPRYVISIPVNCSTRHLFVASHVCNISRGGLFIRSEVPLPLNTEVALELSLPERERSIRATGRVIWNYDIQKGTSHIMPGSGIRFIGMSVSDRATLETYLAGLSPAVSKPPTPHPGGGAPGSGGQTNG